MALTSQEREDFRADIGDTERAFTDAEIDRLYERAGDSFTLAKVLALQQLLASTAKMADYSAGETREDLSQVFKHVEALLERAEADHAETDAGHPAQVAVVGIRSVPPRRKDAP